jgi:hypothetical protein
VFLLPVGAKWRLLARKLVPTDRVKCASIQEPLGNLRKIESLGPHVVIKRHEIVSIPRMDRLKTSGHYLVGKCLKRLKRAKDSSQTQQNAPFVALAHA